jgi:hypothetical protein
MLNFKACLFDILREVSVVKPFIRPDICYPAFGLAGYLAKTVSGASLIIITVKL